MLCGSNLVGRVTSARLTTWRLIDGWSSAKVRRLLADLAALGDDEEGVPLKAVVFSSHKWAVKHLDRALAGAGVSHVTIVKESTSTNRANVETAVARWNTDPNCRVFLLPTRSYCRAFLLRVH